MRHLRRRPLVQNYQMRAGRVFLYVELGSRRERAVTVAADAHPALGKQHFPLVPAFHFGIVADCQIDRRGFELGETALAIGCANPKRDPGHVHKARTSDGSNVNST